MKVGKLSTSLSGGALIALLDAYRAWAPGMKVKTKTPTVSRGVNYGHDRYIVKRRNVQLTDPADRLVWGDEHGNCVCAWVTKITNVHSAEPTVRIEAVVPLSFFDKVDVTDLPVVYAGKKPALRSMPEL